jgi:hypothetical protein
VDLLQRSNERHAVSDAQQHRNHALVFIRNVYHKEQSIGIAGSGASESERMNMNHLFYLNYLN